jgi:Concanavalin A-like lectin/glucanases superfamily
MAGTTLKLGYTNPLTDLFGAHPTLGAVLDLNDGLTFTLASPAGLEIPAPPRTLVLAGNIRTQGEIATRALTRHNRTVTARLLVGPSSSSAALLASIRTLLAWLAAPPQTPITLQYQPFNASAPVYLDVVGAAHNLPADEGMWLRGQFEPLVVSFTCRPGLRGDRVTLQNLIPNPGFEQPTSGPGISVFADTFANSNLYASKAGAAPTAGSVNNAYPDVVLADAPLRYYRMGEASGTTAFDSSGNGVHATYNGGPTLGATGAISGDTADKAVTFAAASSQYAAETSTAGLPTGAGNVSLECWLKFAANPAATQFLLDLGDRNTATHHLVLALLTTGAVQLSNGTATANSGVLTTGAYHHLVGTYDGTNIRLYVDGALVAGPTAATNALSYTGNALTLASQSGATPGAFFSGQLDECAVYGSALASGRVTAHFNAGNAGTGMGTSANTLTIPAAARVAFGSPIWASLNVWQLRLRFTSGGTYRCYLHYTDANNYLRASLSGTALALEHVVAGVTTTLATSALSLASNVWYWLQLTQFPAAPGEVADVQAMLSNDGPVAGTIGAQVATLGPVPTQDAVTALAGQPQLEASGAALILGGPYTNVYTVSLFGPGGWLFGATAGAGNPYGSGAWEQQTLGGVQNPTTYPNGPVSSFGAARIDAPPTGAFDLLWRLYPGGSPTGTFAIPVTNGQTLSASIWLKSSGLAGSASLTLQAREYDAGGALLRTGTVATLSGNQAAWTQLSGTYVTGASCAFVDLALKATDATAGSANGIVWLDNAQCWNKTQLPNQTSMPWCDLRAVVTPAQMVVSGLLGDLPSPAMLALGAYISSLPAGGALSLFVGRKGVTSPAARLVNASYGAFSAAFSPQGFAQLDTGSYGGFDAYAAVGGGGWNPRFASLTAAEAEGVYHLLTRVKSTQTVPNLPSITLRAATAQQTDPWFNLPSSTDIVGQWVGAYVTPFTAQNVWTLADAGQIALPPFPQGALTDPSVLFFTPRAQWQDSSGGSATGYTNWQALLPVDGSLLVATVNNPTNGARTIAAQWLWTYADGLLVNRAAVGDGPSWTFSLEGKPQPNAAAGAGGAGTESSGSPNVNSGADPALIVDPSQVGANGIAGVNQLVAIISDQVGGVYGGFAEVSYSPLYLEPR